MVTTTLWSTFWLNTYIVYKKKNIKQNIHGNPCQIKRKRSKIKQIIFLVQLLVFHCWFLFISDYNREAEGSFTVATGTPGDYNREAEGSHKTWFQIRHLFWRDDTTDQLKLGLTVSGRIARKHWISRWSTTGWREAVWWGQRARGWHGHMSSEKTHVLCVVCLFWPFNLY